MGGVTSSVGRKRLIAGTGRAPLVERRGDLYETPIVAVHALLQVEPLPGVIWECACGPGSIVKVLRDAGHNVLATDLHDYGCPDSESRVDFLMERAPSFAVGAVLTNPPYKLAADFVEHALLLGIPKIVMLLRLQFIESEARRSILDRGMLARVHVFRKRLPMMHRAGWDGPRASNAMTYTWFVWEAAHRGRTELNRISWANPQPEGR